MKRLCILGIDERLNQQVEKRLEKMYDIVKDTFFREQLNRQQNCWPPTLPYNTTFVILSASVNLCYDRMKQPVLGWGQWFKSFVVTIPEVVPDKTPADLFWESKKWEQLSVHYGLPVVNSDSLPMDSIIDIVVNVVERVEGFERYGMPCVPRISPKDIEELQLIDEGNRKKVYKYGFYVLIEFKEDYLHCLDIERAYLDVLTKLNIESSYVYVGARYILAHQLNRRWAISEYYDISPVVTVATNRIDPNKYNGFSSVGGLTRSRLFFLDEEESLIDPVAFFEWKKEPAGRTQQLCEMMANNVVRADVCKEKGLQIYKALAEYNSDIGEFRMGFTKTGNMLWSGYGNVSVNDKQKVLRSISKVVTS